MKAKVLFSILGIIIIVLSSTYIYNHSSPEKAIMSHLNSANFNYYIVKDDYFDTSYGQRYYVKEKDGNFRNNFPHILYLKFTVFGWQIVSGGNAP
ncbi:hypothetical protein [Paenibacillus alba]|uniref:hypothetical protein n=1 Tax=Paenibacillus alba TaxID=1197127 RepID=UPI001565C999|nr:hypothetical protein [Paenibacillus alba]